MSDKKRKGEDNRDVFEKALEDERRASRLDDAKTKGGALLGAIAGGLAGPIPKRLLTGRFGGLGSVAIGSLVGAGGGGYVTAQALKGDRAKRAAALKEKARRK